MKLNIQSLALIIFLLACLFMLPIALQAQNISYALPDSTVNTAQCDEARDICLVTIVTTYKAGTALMANAVKASHISTDDSAVLNVGQTVITVERNDTGDYELSIGDGLSGGLPDSTEVYGSVTAMRKPLLNAIRSFPE